jgi:hypothetical protein
MKPAQHALHMRWQVAILGVAKRPDFFALADLGQELENRVFGRACEANRRPDRATFNQGRDNRDALFSGENVHARIMRERSRIVNLVFG